MTGFLCEPDNIFASNVLVMVIHMCTCTILAIHFSGMCLFIQSRMNFRYSECTVKITGILEDMPMGIHISALDFGS